MPCNAASGYMLQRKNFSYLLVSYKPKSFIHFKHNAVCLNLCQQMKLNSKIKRMEAIKLKCFHVIKLMNFVEIRF